MSDQNQTQETNTEKKPAATGETEAESNLETAIGDISKMTQDPAFEPKKAEAKEPEKEAKKEVKKEEKKTENKSPDELDLDALSTDKGMMSKEEKSEEGNTPTDEEKVAQEAKDKEADAKFQDNTPEELPSGEQERRDGWKAGKAKRKELAEGWKAADAENVELKAKVEALTEQINTSSLESPEYKKMKEEHEQMAGTMEKVAFTQSLAYQKKYTEPMGQMKEAIADFLKSTDSEVTVEQLLSKSREDMMEAVSEIGDKMNSMKQRKFETAVDSFYDLKDQEALDVENSEEFNRNERASNKYNSEQAFIEVSDRVAKDNSVYLQDMEPDDANDPDDVATMAALNESKRGIPVMAKKYLDAELTEKDAVNLAYKASMYDHSTVMMERIKFEHHRDQATIKKLIDHIKAQRAKNPDFEQGSESNKTKAKERSGDPEKDLNDAYATLPKTI